MRTYRYTILGEKMRTIKNLYIELSEEAYNRIEEAIEDELKEEDLTGYNLMMIVLNELGDEDIYFLKEGVEV